MTGASVPREVIGRVVITVQNDVAAAMNAAGIHAVCITSPNDPRLDDIAQMFNATMWPPAEGALLRVADDIAAELDRRSVTPRWARSQDLTADILLSLTTPEGRAQVQQTLDAGTNWLPISEDAQAISPQSAAAAQPSQPEGRSDGARPWPSPMDPSVLYGLAGDFVRLFEPHSEADPAALIFRVLVGFGNVVGRNPHFVVEGDRHRTNLFVLFLGPTGKGRKGVAEGRVRQTFGPIDPEWEKLRVQSGLSSGEGLIWAVRDPITKMEKAKGKGPTVYTEVLADPGVIDKRLMVVEGEFGSTLRVMQRDGNTLSATLRNAWDGKDVLQTMVKNSPAVATGAHISIVGHSTVEELLRYLDRTEMANGFGNRHLIVCVRRSKLLPEGGELKPAALQPLIDVLRQRVNFARSVQRVTFDSEARQLWHDTYAVLSAGRPGLFGAMTARAEPQCLRLAMLYALLDASAVIRVEHLWAAFGLWSYCEASAFAVFGDTLGDPLADEILRALRANANGMTRTDIRNLFSRNKSSNDVERALGVLRRRGLAQPGSEPTGGRSAERWKATTNTTETTKGIDGLDLPSFRSYLSSLPVPPVVEAMLALSPIRPGSASALATATPATPPHPASEPTLQPERVDPLVDALERAHRSGSQHDIAAARQALRGMAGDQRAAVLEADALRDLHDGAAEQRA